MRQRAGIGNMLGSPLEYSRSAAPIEQAGIRSASATPEKRDQKSHSGYAARAEITSVRLKSLPLKSNGCPSGLPAIVAMIAEVSITIGGDERCALDRITDVIVPVRLIS